MERERTRTPRRRSSFAPARTFFRNRLLVRLLTLAAVVLAFTVSVSIFFKVDTVTVTGAQKHSAWSVAEASGVRKGDSLLFFGRSKAAGKIKLALPYVDTVRFEVKLPGTVNIIVEEKPVAYALQAQNGSWWLMTSDGKIAGETPAETAQQYACITGITLAAPAVGSSAVAAEPQQTGETVTTTAADRLRVALSVLTQVETYELFDRITELNVSDLFDLRLYCGPSLRIDLGDMNDLSDKMSSLKGALEQLGVSGSYVLKLENRDGIWVIRRQNWSQP